VEVVSKRAPRRRRSPFSRADALLDLAASGAPEFAWLDGGAGRSFVGVDADRVIESDEIDALAEVERAWRADPGHLWIGWLTYEIGVDALLGRRTLPGRLPGLAFRRYRAAIEHDQGRMRWHGVASAVASLRERLEASGRTPLDRGWPWESLVPVVPPEQHRARVSEILGHIAAGETYQVNLSQVLRGRWRVPPGDGRGLARAVAGAYARLRAATPASMGALVAAGDAWILSNSPETLLDLRLGDPAGALLRTWPIKGTRPRGESQAADQAAAQELVESAKDRAEHLMIVDLLRNDLGRLAIPGTVRAPRTPELVTLPTVHHLISEVSCRLRGGWSLATLFAALFPGGSITGAPKRRTVELIESLEDHRRGIYCGALVVLGPEGLTASIPIRTAVADLYGVEVCTGGGIVADSDPEEERLETLVKASAFDSA